MDIPVLMLVYNRPAHTQKVLRRLEECGIADLYVSADGPRNRKDRKLTDGVRSVIEQCSAVRAARFSEKHSGCKNSVVKGIGWFFDHVESGIILEDDCLPSPYFFPFCKAMLNRYRETLQVKMISGNNPLGAWKKGNGYFFSRIGHVWGWATWKDRWQDFDADLPELDSFIRNNGFRKAFGPTGLAASMQRLTQESVSGRLDTWDYPWNTHILMKKGLSIIPSQNLIEHIGFEDSGTHFDRKPMWISTNLAEEPVSENDVPILPDREYEMEWHLARKADRPALPASSHYSEQGRKSDRKLNVALINSSDKGGGAEKAALDLHGQLQSFGHRSTLFVEDKKSVSSSIVPLTADWEQQIDHLHPDMIHVHNLHGTSISLARIAAISNRIPVIFTLHDSWLMTGSIEHPFEMDAENLTFIAMRQWNSELQVRKELINRSTIRFTAPSQWMREQFFRVHAVRPYWVPNGISSLPSAQIKAPSERYILFVANRPETNPYKDFSTLKSGWKQANKMLGAAACDLVCLGGSPTIEKSAHGSLHILGPKNPDEVNGFMKNALLTVQASRQDNAPLTILEAHRCDKAVVGALVGGIPEMLSPLECEWLYEPGNAHHLAECLVQAIRCIDANSQLRVPKPASAMEMTNMYLGHYFELQANGTSCHR